MKKRMSLISMLLIGTLMTAALTGCGKDASETNNRESINQVSLLQGLTFGDYNGSLSAKEVKALGDTGIGTFDGLNGELVMLDGVIYRAAGDGSVEAVPDTETIPFCDVTFLIMIKVKHLQMFRTLMRQSGIQPETGREGIWQLPWVRRAVQGSL